jgi:ABC-type transporter Mla subunit MlaD
MMSRDYHWKAKLLFIAALCVAVLAAGLWYARSSARSTTYRIETHDPVSGLIADSPVELHGVEVGNVTRIELIDARTVGVLLRVAKDAPVSKATVATIVARGVAARGFTGYAYVALENTGADSGPLTIASGQQFPVIPTAPSVTNTMDTTIADAVQQVRILTRLLQSALDEKTVASLKQSAAGLQEIMATLVANNGRLGSLIVNTERDSRHIGLLLDGTTIPSLKRSMDGLQQIMATLAANNAQIGSLIVNAERDSRDIQPLLETLMANDARIGSLIVNGERDSRKIEPLLETSNAVLREFHSDALPRLYQSLDNLDGLTHLLNGLADKITRDPSTIIHGTVTPPGPGER